MREHASGRVPDAPVVLVGSERKDELVVEQMEGFDLRIVDGKRDQYQVEVAAHKLTQQSLGHRLTELQIELGEAPLQLGQGRRQEVRRDGRNGPELQRPRQHPIAMLSVVEQIAHGGEDGPRPSDDLRAVLVSAMPDFRLSTRLT
jgi:hypothetical protein